MKHRLLHLLLVIMPLQAHEPSRIRRHLPYSRNTQSLQLAFSPEVDWVKELRRSQSKANLRSRGHKREFNLEKKRKYSWFDIGVRAALLGFCGWLAWNNRYEMIAAVLGGEVFLRHQIRVANSQCDGREMPISDGITFKQVKVAHQSGATCGYHGGYRCMQLVDAFNNGRADLAGRLLDAREIRDLIKTGRRPDQDGPWRRLVKLNHERLRGMGRGKAALRGSTWIHDGDIEEIIANEASPIGGHRVTNPNFDRHQISVCANPSLLGQEGFDSVTPVTRARGLGVAYPLTHGFVLGNMQQYGDTSGSAGHWIAVVFRHQPDGRKEYIVADSMNSLTWRGDDHGIYQLLRVLEGREVADAYRNGGS